MDIGIIVVTHGNLADALKSTLFSIVGEKKNFESLSIPTNFTLETLCQNLDSIIKKLSTQYIVIFTDILGGSACNASIFLCKNYKNVYIISGVNLYMLIASIHLRENSSLNNIEEYVQKVIEEAKKSICCVNSIFKNKF
ncbi:MAG: PTS sugar transporter subunit IIA [Elusimicrobiota bacterium]|nr:PTS sugar transporter subunit IIA [Endomicrobiia bacterium]MDW8164982.1 PTS sugar transporter subunit IIA [Elusimicrobiota bacterium]